MTPAFRSIFKKALGTTPEDSDPAQPPAPGPAGEPSARPSSGLPDEPPEAGGGPDGPDGEEDAPRRRRGRRGGRGRRKSTAGTPEPVEAAMTEPATPAVTRRAARREPARAETRGATSRGAAALAPAPIIVARRRPGGTPPPAAAEPRSYGWGRRVEADEARDGDRGRRGRRMVRPRDLQHEPPLPEDVAFRAPAEGGDRTIFPGRRRRPQGIREDERVLLAGPRSLGGWIERDIPLQPYEPYVPRPYAVAVALGVRDPFTLVAPEGVAVEPDLVPAVDVDAVVSEAHAIVEAAVEPPLAEASESAPGEDGVEGARKRRRRGRRGGRNRRRRTTEGDAGEALDTGTEDEDDAVADGLDVQPARTAIDATVHVASHVAPALEPGEVNEADATAEDIGTPVTRGRVADAHERPRIERRRSARPGQPVAATTPEAVVEEPVAAEAERAEAAASTGPRRAQRRAPAAVVDPMTYPAAFAALGATERTLPALATFGFQQPTPIQEQAIPALLDGRDVVGIAKTGSGKTVAFGVPMVERLDADLGEVQGIVLVPTRELAQQVLDVLQALAAPRGMQAIGLLGGHAIRNDLQALERRPQIVVGTPGRIIDHLQRGTLSLRLVTYAVLDEADQMLDIGFLPDIRRILSRTPKRRQTALFSATMPGSIRRLIWQFMTDPQQVAADAESTPVESIEQIYFEVAHRDKAAGLRELIERELKGRTLVFCKTKRAVDMLERDLSRMGVRVGALHGDMDQRHRDRVIADFRSGALDVLVATNVAARGLDIPEITHVLNFDVPQNVEEYVHRIGRTGRAGREGKAITFVSEWDMGEFDAIRAEFGERLREERLDLYRPRAAASPGPTDEPEASPAAG